MMYGKCATSTARTMTKPANSLASRTLPAPMQDAGDEDDGGGGDDDDGDGDEDGEPQEIVAGVAGRERRRNFGVNTYLGADEEVSFSYRHIAASCQLPWAWPIAACPILHNMVPTACAVLPRRSQGKYL